MSLYVSEIFTAWQGEGPSTGRLATFLRLGGCNLTCTWCDTPYTWDASRYNLRDELTRRDTVDIIDDLPGGLLLVITGGEPLLQAAGIAALLDGLPSRDVEVETNGTLPPPPWADRAAFNVSPKLTSSGHASDLHPSWRDVPSAVFKFVVQNPADLDAVAAYRTPADRTWVMPEGTEAEQVLKTARWFAADVLNRGWNLTLRQHVLLWGAERGR